MADTFLDLINEHDEVIGQALRSEIHAKGLLHREVHVWFVTPDKQIIFQIRKPSPPKFPLRLLDATAGGHVELGHSYLETALKEVFEETGIEVKEEGLFLYKKIRATELFPENSKTNAVFRATYIYKFAGNVEGLTPEAGTGKGFIAISAEDFLNKAEWIEKELNIIPFLHEEEMTTFFNEVANG